MGSNYGHKNCLDQLRTKATVTLTLALGRKSTACDHVQNCSDNKVNLLQYYGNFASQWTTRVKFTFPEADPPATPMRNGLGGMSFIISLLELICIKSVTEAILSEAVLTTFALGRAGRKIYSAEETVVLKESSCLKATWPARKSLDMAFLSYYFRTCLGSAKRWSDLIVSRCFVSSRNFCSKHFDGRKTYDVAIIGGGIMGSSSAYFLANRMSSRINNICVIERDPTVSQIKIYYEGFREVM